MVIVMVSSFGDSGVDVEGHFWDDDDDDDDYGDGGDLALKL